MNQRVLAVLLLALTLVMIVYIDHMSDHDTITKVMDVNHFRLKGGRSVYAIGVESSGLEIDSAKIDARAQEMADSLKMEHEGLSNDSALALVKQMTDRVALADTLPNPERDRFNAMLAELSTEFVGKRVNLHFSREFSPDSADASLHAFIHIGDTLNVSAWLLEHGYGRLASEQTFPLKKMYLKKEQMARDAGVGIWAAEMDSMSGAGGMEPGM